MYISKEKEKSTSYVVKLIKENKLISFSIIMFLGFCTLNFILIFNFMKILGSNF